jgi:Flp pilus assembly protein TadG
MPARLSAPLRRIRAANRSMSRGQSLAEFAIVAPVFFLLVAGVIQFGIIFWGQNSLNQVARDTGRWAATLQTCDPGTATPQIVATANAIAAQSSLIGYATGSWTSPTNVIVSWNTVSGTCPPSGNQNVSFVRITINHQVPIFFPLIPGSGALSTTTEFRVEPVAN